MKGQFGKFGKGPMKGSPIKGGKGKKGKGKSKDGKASQPTQNTPKGKGKSKSVQCYNCWEYGHKAQNCPNRMIYGFEHDPAWGESWEETGYEVDEFNTELGNFQNMEYYPAGYYPTEAWYVEEPWGEETIEETHAQDEKGQN